MNVHVDRKSAPDAALATRYDRHFRTDHLMSDLKGRSVRGGAITTAAQGAKFVLQTGSTMVLARLLTPADFGLVAMVTVLINMVSLFKDAGLSMATVQQEKITQEQVSALFWINVGLGGLVMLITAACAPLIAWFYGEPRLVPITLVLASSFVFGGMAVQHQALMRRQMRFRELATIEIVSMAAGIAAAIAIALTTHTYWALVAMPFTMAVVTPILTWFACRWVPGPLRRGANVWPMLKFGGHLTGFNAVNFISRSADQILIGWWWGAGALGFYSRAYSLVLMPLRQINAPIVGAALPTLSRLQNDPERYRRAFLLMLQTICIVAMPALGMMVVMADPLVLILLGKDWADVAPVFALLGVAGVFQPVNFTMGPLLMSQGRSRDQLLWGLIVAVVIVLAFAVALPYGIIGVAAAYSITILIFTPLAWIWAGRTGPVSALDIAKTVRFPLTVTLHGIAPMLYLWWRPVSANTWTNHGVGLAAGLVAMAAAVLILPTGRRILGELNAARRLILKPRGAQ